MPIGASWFYAAALLLAGAGIAKLSEPAAVEQALARARLPGIDRWQRIPLGRTAGVVEVGVAVSAFVWGNRLTAALVALAYLAFAAVAARLISVTAGAEPCGCFGETDTPTTGVHVAVDVAAAAAAAVAVAMPAGSVLDLPARQPWHGVPFLAATLALAWLGYLAFTALPELLSARQLVERHD